MSTTLVLVIAIITSIISGIIFFYIGKNVVDSKSNIEEFRLKKLLQEQEQLHKENLSLDATIKTKTMRVNDIIQQINQLDIQYKFQQQNLQEVENKISNLHKATEQNYLIQKQELEQKYLAHKQELENDIANRKEKLDSLKRTYAAAVEADKREEEVRRNVDAFRLKISEQDKQDIRILQTIKYQVSKPRVLDMLIWQTYYQPIAKQRFPIILGTNNVCGIYKITNINDNKTYIGQAINVRERWNQHCKCGLGIDTPAGNKLYQAMQTDGLYSFTFQLVEQCAPSELNDKEAFYIDMYNSVSYGYNGQQGNK